jgi:DNA-binding CsgD family transcriptional regulator
MPKFNFHLHDIKVKRLLALLFPPAALILILFLVDISLDIHEKINAKHFIIEFLICTVSLYIGYIFYRFYRLDKKSIDAVKENISENNAELKYWQNQNKTMIEGLSIKIHEQFRLWGLTQAENDVALLIIKGFSLEEIASLRGTSERTIRDQAAAVYHKAKLKNRIELSAYFLEDLLSPHSD